MQIPPRWLERLVELLTPPRHRENLLGDFREIQNVSYLIEAIITIPLMIWSEVRRTNRLAVVLTEAVSLMAIIAIGSRLAHYSLSLAQLLAIGVTAAALLALRRAFWNTSSLLSSEPGWNFIFRKDPKKEDSRMSLLAVPFVLAALSVFTFVQSKPSYWAGGALSLVAAVLPLPLIRQGFSTREHDIPE